VTSNSEHIEVDEDFFIRKNQGFGKGVKSSTKKIIWQNRSDYFL
jgi:hypothetical protein